MTETKVLKQLVRDVIQPEMDLGHSDKKDKSMGSNATKEIVKDGNEEKEQGDKTCDDCKEGS